MKKFQLYLAGLVAMLLGMPLTEKAFGGVSDVIDAGIDLGLGIASLSRGS